jgi:hypothetical protein
MAAAIAEPLPAIELLKDPALGIELLPEREQLCWAFLTRKGNLSNTQRVYRETRRFELAQPFEDLIAGGIAKEGADPATVPIGLNEISDRLFANPPGFRTVGDAFHAINQIVRYTLQHHAEGSHLAAAATGMIARGVFWFRKYASKIHRLDNPETPYCAACGNYRTWETNCVMLCESCPMILHMRCHGLPPGSKLRESFTCNACQGLPSELDRVFVKPATSASKALASHQTDRVDDPALPAAARGRRKAAVAA